MLSEIEKLLNKKEIENKFWDIEVDEAFNFRYYYERDNACHFSNVNKYVPKKKNPKKSFMYI